MALILTPEHRQTVIDAIVSTSTYKRAAGVAGISLTTLYRYLRNAEFGADLAAARAAVRLADANLQRLGVKTAWESLIEDAENAPTASERTAAAREIREWQAQNRRDRLEQDVAELKRILTNSAASGSVAPSAGPPTQTAPS